MRFRKCFAVLAGALLLGGLSSAFAADLIFSRLGQSSGFASAGPYFVVALVEVSEAPPAATAGVYTVTLELAETTNSSVEAWILY